MTPPTTPAPPITLSPLPPNPPSTYTAVPPPHHVGNPPTHFKNPWPSFSSNPSISSIVHMRFLSKDRNFVPVPETRDELVPIQVPDWGVGRDGLRCTWIGHASFFVELSAAAGARGAGGEEKDGSNASGNASGSTSTSTSGSGSGSGNSNRGIRLLLDPVFSERMSPVSFLGPKRFSPPPCALEDLPDVDVVLVSHNHYDHLDAATIRFVRERGGGSVRFVCALGNAAYLRGMGVLEAEIVECDWWEGVRVDVEGVGACRVVCAPAQHGSARGVGDSGVGLWCSWVVLEGSGEDSAVDEKDKGKRLYFSGDTAYRTVPTDDPTTDLSTYPSCPAFAEIGALHGPFDLALVPIGCYSPRSFMSRVHCSPDDALEIHRDVRSKRSVGMHYGTVRGGLSNQYEDVREPPRRWREVCEKAGLRWGEGDRGDWEVGVIGIGETVVV